MDRREVGLMKKKIFNWEDIEKWTDVLNEVENIEDYYTHIRLFHACKPTDIESYYINGIQPLDIEHIRNKAHDIFRSNDFPEIKDEDIEEAIQQIQAITPEGIIYLALGKRDLVQSCGHYLIYGSEFILGMANELRNKYGNDYSKILKTKGIPTVFSCDIPIDIISKFYLDDLNQRAKNILTIEDLKYDDAPLIDFSVPIGQVIYPSYIVSHYHPKRIKDPLNHNEIYIPDSNTCSRCSKEISNEEN